MREKISELVDGELQGHDAQALLSSLRGEGEARRIWREYHLIGDAMRDSKLLSRGFARRVMSRLDGEPTVMAQRLGREGSRARWIGLQMAAGVAAVALVGWLALAPQRETPAPVAQAPKPAPAVPAESAPVPPPAATVDYLLAHQRYSPRNALQGVAPYVRTVANDAGPRKP